MAITDGIITLADARASLGFNNPAITTYDSIIEDYIEAATPVIENIAGPVLVKSRTLTFNGGTDRILLPYKVTSITSVTIGGTASTDYTADLANGILYAGAFPGGSAFTSGLQNVVVVVSVGNATYPPNVLLATRELVRFWYQQGQQANRPGTADVEASSPTPQGFLVPKRVLELLRPTFNVGGFA